jgi:hypothetical protein
MKNSHNGTNGTFLLSAGGFEIFAKKEKQK